MNLVMKSCAPFRTYSLLLRCIISLAFFIPVFSYSQTFFGVSSTPADNGAQAGPIVAVTPPGSMVAGDLVIIYAQYRASPAILSISAAGGQTWNTAATNTGTNQTYYIFWCRFNGTWGADPSVTAGAGNTLGLTVVMYVYRPANSNSSWGLNIGPSYSSTTATAQSITGITTTAPNTVTMGFWSSASATTWGTLTGAGWSKTSLGAQYRNTTGGQSHTAAYNITTTPGAVANVSQTQSANVLCLKSIMAWHELNDFCNSAPVLTSGTTCTNMTGTLQNATVSSPAVPTACGTAGGDVWYSFTAQTAYPVITLSSMGSNMDNNPSIQLLSGSCAALTNVGCVTGASVTTLALDTRTIPGGAGLTVGDTYYIRIYSNTLLPTGASWNFKICVTDRTAGKVDYSKSYVNITKGLNGGTVNPGDTLEIRAVFVVSSNATDSLAFYDTLFANKGLKLVPGSITLRTNEGKVYKSFTDIFDTDAGWRIPSGSDTAIQINFGAGASNVVRGKLRNTSKPSFYGASCIIMATYRVEVYAGYNTKINWGGGAFSYRDTATGNMRTIAFRNDSLVVYISPGLCSNTVSTINKVGIETNGTFNTPSGSAPLARNRGTSAAVPGYTYDIFRTGGGPQDYYYGVSNNTSATFSTISTLAKSGSVPQRVFNLWDIIGDHTGATNTSRGNPPCDTTKPVSASNPCGYMLVVNSAYKTDTAFQSTITNLCPNTYYEISAWIRNICYKCGCDSMGRGAGTAGYIPFAPNDSSGVQPNLAFQINGQDYYSTGNIAYTGTGPGITQQASDTVNQWVKRGFVYKTETTQTSFELLIRNNAPGGGGNDWAIDDISVSTCLPNMNYSPSLNPNVCDSNTITIYDTVRSSYDNYTYYKWQRSTDGGTTWTDVTGPLGPATPFWNGTAWEYVASYVIPPSEATMAHNGDMYRMIVATTSANLSNTNCQFTDVVSIVTINVIDCGGPLNMNFLSFNGKLLNDHSNLFWSTSEEIEPLHFDIERSIDGLTFAYAGTINAYNNYGSQVNHYSFIDPLPVRGNAWYRIVVVNKNSSKKYSRIIQLNNNQNQFGLINLVNPFTNELQFDITTPADIKMDVALIDMTGRPIMKKTYTVFTGVNGLSLENTGRLPSGMYILQIKNKEIIINRKVLKK